MTATADRQKTVRLSAIVAVARDAKTNGGKALTQAHFDSLKSGDQSPMVGISREYSPVDEDGERQPNQRTLVQYTVEDLLKQVATGPFADMFDVLLTQEHGNTIAKADVVVGEQTLLRDVPVGYLLFLEKRLTDLHTFVSKLPTLDPAEKWDWNDEAGQTGAHATEPTSTKSTKKIPRNHVKAEAVISPSGQISPAQVELFTEDVIVGYWKTIKFSGHIRGDRKRELVSRVEKLQRAVKTAREEANASTVPQLKAADPIFGYLFAE